MSSSSHPYHLDANQRRGRECIRLRPFSQTPGKPEASVFQNSSTVEEGEFPTGKTWTYTVWRNAGDYPTNHPEVYPPPHNTLWQTNPSNSFAASMGVSCPTSKTKTENTSIYAYYLDKDLVEIPGSRATYTASITMNYSKSSVSATVSAVATGEGYQADTGVRGYVYQYYEKMPNSYDIDAQTYIQPSFPIVTSSGAVPARAGIGYVKLDSPTP